MDPATQNRLTKTEFIEFLHNFRDGLNAGKALLEALDEASQSKHQTIQAIASEMRRAAVEGESLWDVFGRYPEWFPKDKMEQLGSPDEWTTVEDLLNGIAAIHTECQAGVTGEGASTLNLHELQLQDGLRQIALEVGQTYDLLTHGKRSFTAVVYCGTAEEGTEHAFAHPDLPDSVILLPVSNFGTGWTVQVR